MKELIDNCEIDIPCENCRRVTKKTIGWIKTNDKFTCGCGTVITLESKKLGAKFAKVEQSIVDLGNAMKELEN